MTAEEIEHTALVFSKPLSLFLGVTDTHLRLDGKYLPKFTVFCHLESFLNLRIEAVHIAHLQNEVFFLDNINQSVVISNILTSGLVKMNVNTSLGKHKGVFSGAFLLAFDSYRINV